MNNVNLVRTILANAPPAERAILAREVKEALSMLDGMLTEQQRYTPLKTASDLCEAALEEALSMMPPSTQYTLFVSRDGYDDARDLLGTMPDGYDRAFMPRVQLEVSDDARDGEWWVTNRLTRKSVGSYVG